MMMHLQKRLIVMGGGTGGHVFPGLAVAHLLITQGWQVRWLGTANRIEADIVKKYGIEIDFIIISGLKGRGLKALLLAPVRILNAWLQSRTIMKRFKPDIALGMGGYVSGPGGLAAWSLGIPLILHEQNGVPGLTNKYLAKIAIKVMQAFPGAFPNADVVGNPVRIDVLGLPPPQQRLIDRKGPVRVLVLGGSQGANILNQVMPQVAEKLDDTISIWHQSGKGARQRVKQTYDLLGQPQHKVTAFINDIAAAYDWADVVICRSGALTVSEIAVVGLPAIFVPFPHKDRQQYLNALPLKKVGAAKIFEQQQFNADLVVNTLMEWNRKILFDMAKRARSVAIPNATEQVADAINLLAKTLIL